MEDRADQRNETPEMSGDRDEMREPIDEVNPPEDVIPFQHEITDDSTIAPVEGGTHETGDEKLMDAERLENDRDRNAATTTAPSTSSAPSSTVRPETMDRDTSIEGESNGTNSSMTPSNTRDHAVPANPE